MGYKRRHTTGASLALFASVRLLFRARSEKLISNSQRARIAAPESIVVIVDDERQRIRERILGRAIDRDSRSVLTRSSNSEGPEDGANGEGWKRTGGGREIEVGAVGKWGEGIQREQ